MKVSIFWFRRDLRLVDNIGLNHALLEKSNVLPIFIFDDYEGKFSCKDQFYYNKKGYENNSLIQIKESVSEKRGVKTAIDEFILKDGNFKTFKLMIGEPIVAIDVNNEILKVDTWL